MNTARINYTYTQKLRNAPISACVSQVAPGQDLKNVYIHIVYCFADQSSTWPWCDGASQVWTASQHQPSYLWRGPGSIALWQGGVGQLQPYWTAVRCLQRPWLQASTSRTEIGGTHWWDFQHLSVGTLHYFYQAAHYGYHWAEWKMQPNTAHLTIYE